jgi:hypothetical protein
MDAVEKLGLKHSLVIEGLWNDEEGDPATDEKATAALLLKIKRNLGQGAYLFFPPTADSFDKREVRVNWGGMTSVLARGEDLPTASCLTALELPNFLERHPECAATAEPDEDISDSLPGLGKDGSRRGPVRHRW